MNFRNDYFIFSRRLPLKLPTWASSFGPLGRFRRRFASFQFILVFLGTCRKFGATLHLAVLGFAVFFVPEHFDQSLLAI